MSKTTIRDIRAAYEAGEPITMLTAYDAPIARLVDRSGVDITLVGDSAGHNHLGYEGTLQVTMDEALSNTAAVVRGTTSALVLADMPFMSYGSSITTSVENAGRFLKEAGADGVKLETAPSGGITVDIIDRLTDLGIPVQGHVGLTPQRVNEMGGAVVQGREGPESAFGDRIVNTAQELEESGVFSLVIEGTTEALAKRITEAIDIPTIGIGAGRHVDGQVLVTNDVIGLDSEGYRLSKQYADVDSVIEDAVSEFLEEVRHEEFPTAEHTYDPLEDD